MRADPCPALQPKVATNCSRFTTPQCGLLETHWGGNTVLWSEPFDRSVFSLLTQFGDAEIATLILPRTLIVEACRGPEIAVTAPGGSQGVLQSPNVTRVRAEIERASKLVEGMSPAARIELIANGTGQGPFGSVEMLNRFLGALNSGATLSPGESELELAASRFDPRARQQRQTSSWCRKISKTVNGGRWWCASTAAEETPTNS